MIKKRIILFLKNQKNRLLNSRLVFQRKMTTKKIKNGLVVEYFSNGEVESKENYKNGKLDGKSVYWHENGILSEVANYKNLVLHGHRTLYNNKGQITLFNNYENGKLLDDKDNEFIEPFGDGDIIEVALFLLKGLPNTAIKDTEFLINYASIDIFSDAGSSLRALLSYLQSELYGKYCLHYYGEDSNEEPNEDLYEKAKNEVEAFIKILQYRLYENPKLEHTDLLHDISFTKEELGIDHHRSSHS